MASYHFSWDLELFGYLDPGTASSGLLKLYARTIATSFLFLVGISLALSARNGIDWRKYGRRLAQITAASALITIATMYATPDGYIFFGILHHIAFASVIGLLFLGRPWLALVAAAAILALPHVTGMVTANPLLDFIGLAETPPHSNDFVPLVPWLSASFAGLALTQLMLPVIERQPPAPSTDEPERLQRLLRAAGRHSLLFYLVHQPVLIALVWCAAQLFPPAPGIGDGFHASCIEQCTPRFAQDQCERYCVCMMDAIVDARTTRPEIAIEGAQLESLVSQCSAEVFGPATQ